MEVIIGIIGVVFAISSLIIRFKSNDAGTQVILVGGCVLTDIIEITVYGDTGWVTFMGLTCWLFLLVWDTKRWLESR
jgi:hypothetical protein